MYSNRLSGQNVEPRRRNERDTRVPRDVPCHERAEPLPAKRRKRPAQWNETEQAEGRQIPLRRRAVEPPARVRHVQCEDRDAAGEHPVDEVGSVLRLARAGPRLGVK